MEELTEEQRLRIEENRQKALAKRKANKTAQLINSTVKVKKLDAGDKLGDGFMKSRHQEETLAALKKDPQDMTVCDCCHTEFLESLLRSKFDEDVCDNCRKSEEKYRLVPRTEAKSMYHLKDCDIDKRPPPLKFMEKPNPHRDHGYMKLYLVKHLEERAVMVWGSLDQLDKEDERKLKEKEKRNKVRLDNKIKKLRKELRIENTKLSQTHEHEFGDEVHNEETDEYEKECKTCGHKLSYERM